MARGYAQHFSTTSTPQSQPIPGTNQVPNSAGGFCFPVDDWTRLSRFLLLGNAGGSYYASEQKLTVENAECVQRCLAADGLRTVKTIVDVSVKGRAPKNDEAVFALGMALQLGDQPTRRAAREAVPAVCRIGTHLFQLAEAVKAFGAWHKGTRKAFGDWYAKQDVPGLALQLVKYQQRDGWAHRDLIRLGREVMPAAGTPHDGLMRWAVRGADGLAARTALRFKHDSKPEERAQAKLEYEKTGTIQAPLLRVDSYPGVELGSLPAIVGAFEEMKKAKTAAEAVGLIRKHGLPRECVPTELLKEKAVWEALLMAGRGMPLHALLRNLGKMASIGLLAPMSEAEGYVAKRLADVDGLHKARVHPIAILLALAVYRSGHGIRGGLSWSPTSRTLDALDEAFYGAFKSVEPTGKRWLLGLDVSTSMDGGSVAGTPLTPRQCVGAMAMVTARVEESHHFVGFSHRLVDVPISPRMRLDTVVETMRKIPYGGTDASLPVAWALQTRTPVDVFFSLTDNESWAGRVHPIQALQVYRQKMGIPAKLVVAAVTATETSIGDPNDGGCLDVVGWDTNAPSLISDFARA